MNIPKNTFAKEERLCSEKDIENLYKLGTSFLNFPIVFYHLSMPEIEHTKLLVSVSKKKFKKAVDRNLIKRRLREAYRLNKTLLQKKHQLGFVFISNKKITYSEILKSVVEGLKRIDKGG